MKNYYFVLFVMLVSFIFMGCPKSTDTPSNLNNPFNVDLQVVSYKGLYPDTIEISWMNNSQIARLNLVEISVSIDTMIDNIKPINLLALADTLEYGKDSEEKTLRLSVDKLLTNIDSNRKISVFATVRAAIDISHISVLSSSPTVRVR